MKNFAAPLLALVTVLALAACGQQTPAVNFSAVLSGADEVPAVSTAATGSVTATLQGRSLTIKGTFSGLSAAPSEAHIHEGAAGANGPVVFPLTIQTVTTDSGSFNQTTELTDAQVNILESDRYYINVHTTNYPDGEIRGQLERLLE